MMKIKRLYIQSRERVYISGPMTDKNSGHISEKNIAAFYKAEEILRQLGCERVVNPARFMVCRFPFLYRFICRIVGTTMSYRLTLLYDLYVLGRCTKIYKIPGWRESTGSNIESCWAYHMGIFPLHRNVQDYIDKRLALWLYKI